MRSTELSAKLFAEAAAVIPGGVNSPVRAFSAVGGTPRFITSAQGCWLTDADDNPVAELTMVPLSNGDVAAGATLVAPLETDLIDGLGFQIGSGEMRGYPFSFCAPVGCVARLGFTNQELASMKAGSTAAVQLLPFGGDPDSPVQLSMSLTGFTAAFDELAAYAAVPAPAPAADAEPAEDAPAEDAPAE